MSQVIPVTGPVQVFVDLDGPGLELLGTCMTRPRIMFRRKFEPAFSDIGGLVPFDMIYAGSDALVILDINRLDTDTMQCLRAVPTMDEDNIGVEHLGDVGSMMMLEGLGIELSLSFMYGLDANSGPINGLRFPCAFLLGPDTEEDGVRFQIQRLVFYCMRQFDPDSGDMTLFDNDVQDGLGEDDGNGDQAQIPQVQFPNTILPKHPPGSSTTTLFTIIGSGGVGSGVSVNREFPPQF